MADLTTVPCPPTLAAYHDGELSAADRAAVAAHVAACPGCESQLAGLRQSSAWIAAAAATVSLDRMGRERLHRRLRDAADGGLVRLGWEMSGVAAAVLLAGSVWLARSSAESPGPASVPPWVGATADGSGREAVTPAAAWYLADARTGSTDGGW